MAITWFLFSSFAELDLSSLQPSVNGSVVTVLGSIIAALLTSYIWVFRKMFILLMKGLKVVDHCTSVTERLESTIAKAPCGQVELEDR